jgi:hypothetical protein
LLLFAPYKVLEVQTSKLPLAIALALTGVVYGLGLGLIGLLLSGAGHGWGSGTWSGLAVLVLPVFGVAWAYSEHLVGRVLLVLVVFGMIGLDAFLLYMAWDEGSHYLHKLWAAQGGLALWLIWLVLWLIWQFAVIAAVIVGQKRSAAGQDETTNRGKIV